MSIAPKLADGESFVAGRSIAKARELVEAAEAAGLAGSVITVSHGYVVPTSILADTDVEAKSEEKADEFDPSEATVAEVKAYLDGADETERERVLAAETEGKNRSTVLSYTPEGE